MRRCLAISLALPLLLMTVSAGADVSPTDRAVARTLFEEGRRLFKEGAYERACPKFAESMRLDPASGTQLNLAVCHERIGRTATAWSEFNDAVTRARQDGRPDREKLALERIASLEPRLSRLEVVVPRASRVEGLRVMLGDVEIREAAWGVPTPIDPGEHEIRATAPGRETWSRKVTVGEEADRRRLEIPVLRELPEEQPEKGDPRPPASNTVPDSGSSSQRTLGWVLGGAGLLAAGTGAYFGWQAHSRWADVENVCPGGLCPDPQTRDANMGLRDDAARAATVSTVAFVAGGALVAAGGWLVLSSSDEPAGARVGIAPGASGTCAGATLRGGF